MTATAMGVLYQHIQCIESLDSMCTCMFNQVAYQPVEGVHEGQLLPLGALIEGYLLAVGDDARVDIA